LGGNKLVYYSRAVKRPFKDIPTLVIGIIIGLIPVVSLLTAGFGMKAAKASLKNDAKLPKWNDWGFIIVKTLGFIGISVVYLIPAAIVFLIGLGSAAVGIITSPLSIGGITAGSATVLGAIVIAAVLGVLAILTIPMAAMHYLSTGKFSKAFALKEVARKAFSGKYIVAWLFSMVYFFILVLVMAVFSIVPVVGLAIGSGVFNFLGNTTSMTVYAEAYKEAK